MSGTPPGIIRWNKSSATNLAAAACIGVGLAVPEPFRHPILYVGLFALSGAFTNWLAVHMLFERVPGLYGSGVIPARFQDFKRAIHRLISEQFFSREHFERFFAKDDEAVFDFDPAIEKTDVNPAFDALASLVESSSFGGLLRMFGGASALEALREPFAVKMKKAMKDIGKSPVFQKTVRSSLASGSTHDAIKAKIDDMVRQRLEELTPQLVKEIMQQMIRDHLGWLVVWGGVFGGLIGLVTSVLPFA